MKEYKLEQCPACRYKHHVAEPKKNLPCPHCGTLMKFSERWYVQYTHQGVSTREAISPDRKRTRLYLKDIEVQIAKGVYTGRPQVTSWSTAVTEFKKWMPNNITAKSQAMYDNSLVSLTEAFSGKALQDITKKDVDDYKDWRKTHRLAGHGHKSVQEFVSDSTINRDLATIKRMLRLCIEWELIADTPRVRGILRVKLAKEEPRTRYLTEEEQAALLKECEGKPRLKLAVLIALNTGLRADGVKRMKRSDIDLKRNVITRICKGGARVDIPITETLRQAILDYPLMGEYLFPSMTPRGKLIRKGEAIRADADMGFAKACERSGIEGLHFHDLRHTFATFYLDRTNDMRGLQELLGHADIQTTMKYAHILKDHLAQGMRQFEQGGVYGGNPGGQQT